MVAIQTEHQAKSCRATASSFLGAHQRRPSTVGEVVARLWRDLVAVGWNLRTAANEAQLNDDAAQLAKNIGKLVRCQDGV